ncbi:VWA domain-containing protein [Sebaldella sp. S0638]|uniref:vWA domain-containing protein n=1 Tax=Sebaldella sp. S0638 TaxID=2957809 RepID=UPI00209C7998|nr:VWA domain-containing protein [Sebaldella sp. S0638]MCP1223565.1 VWA domain-containing protein [Sebaldella sp. S0638]
MKKKTMLFLLGALIFLFSSCTMTDRKEVVVVQQVMVEKPVEKIVYVDRVISTGKIESNGDVLIGSNSAVTIVNAKGATADLRSEYSIGTESYSEINENGFIDAKTSPLSTFSIDVDTASYTNVRRMLMTQGKMPPKDSVRIEEMINYFSYDYKKPEKENGKFGFDFEMGDSPWNNKNKILRIGIQGENLKEDKKPKSNLVFLIDVSGSMNHSNKLPLLKESFKKLVNNLNSEDRVSIVVYAGNAGVVLEPTSGKEKDKIIEALDNLSAGGSTAGGEGIKKAYDLAVKNLIKNGNNRVILATDGDFNVGVTSGAELEGLIASYKKKNIYLTILGFGMGNYKDDTMERLSNKGNGNYFYIDNLKEADKVFDQGLMGTLYTIAKDVKIQIEFNPAVVKEYRLIGYENRKLANEDFKNDKKDAGDVGSGHQVTVLYEIVPKNGNSETDVDKLVYQDSKVKNSSDIATFKLRYKEPDGDKSKELKEVLKQDIYKKNNTNDFNFAVSAAEFGMLLRNSEHKGNLTYEDVLKLAKNNKENDKYGYKAEFIQMIEKAAEIEKASENTKK